VIRDERDFVANRTVLDAGANAVTTLSFNTKEKITVDGFILTGAKTGGHNINASSIQDTLQLSNCIINNQNRVANGAIILTGNSIQGVVLFLNCIVTNTNATSSAPIEISGINCTFINTIAFKNMVNSAAGSSGCINVISGGIFYLIHSAIINNIIVTGGSPTFPNAIYKNSTSTIKIYNSAIWNDTFHSVNGRNLVNLVDSLVFDHVEFSILDSNKVRTRRFKKNGSTWGFNKDTDPVYKSLDNPGGENDEYWFTSNCGLIYDQDKPGIDDGGLGYISYTWLQWDIRGQSFVRNVNGFPDIGPFEKQSP